MTGEVTSTALTFHLLGMHLVFVEWKVTCTYDRKLGILDF